MVSKADRHYFLLRRLHSLLGIFPVSVFLVEHFFSNSFAFGGPERFNSLVESLQTMPLIVFLEIGLIGGPILFHAVLGLVIMYTGKNNFVDYGYYRNWAYFFQRVTGVVALVFVIVHAWETRISMVFENRHFTFADMQQILTPAWAKWWYGIGILCTVFHFSNGIATALITWGVMVSKRSQTITAYASWVLFGVMSVWGLRIIWEFVA